MPAVVQHVTSVFKERTLALLGLCVGARACRSVGLVLVACCFASLSSPRTRDSYCTGVSKSKAASGKLKKKRDSPALIFFEVEESQTDRDEQPFLLSRWGQRVMGREGLPHQSPPCPRCRSDEHSCCARAQRRRSTRRARSLSARRPEHRVKVHGRRAGAEGHLARSPLITRAWDCITETEMKTRRPR